MVFGRMRRALHAWRAGSAPRDGLLPLVPRKLGAPLEALGAVPMAAKPRVRERGATLLAAFEDPVPASTALLALAFSVTSPDSAAQLWVAGADGTVHDRVAVAPGEAPATAWLLAPPDARLEIVFQSAPLTRGAGFLAGGAWALREEALAPERIVPDVPLVADAQWSRAYGTVEAADAAGRLRERVFAGLARPVLVEAMGVRLWLEPGDELSRAVLLSGLYEPSMLLAMRSLLPEGGVFADIGAHCGLVAAFGARRVGPAGRVIAFEPSPREFARLQANLAAGDLTQVEARRTAVADAPGTFTLRLAEAGHAGHNTLGERFAYEGVAVAELVPVEAVTLDQALAGLDRCDLIKMDIEGAELRALRGGAAALARLRPAMIIEVFDRSLAGCGDTEAGVLAWLDAAGYDAREIDLATGRYTAPARVSPGESRNVVALPRR